LKILQILKLLNAEAVFIPSGAEDYEIEYSGAADLMSDFLAFSREHMLLITGLTSPQTITTAAVIGANGVIFVRGKEIPPEVMKTAQELDIPILKTSISMYIACAILYKNGIKDAMGTDSFLNNGDNL
jgi:predicted transcriptional regulator